MSVRTEAGQISERDLRTGCWSCTWNSGGISDPDRSEDRSRHCCGGSTDSDDHVSSVQEVWSISALPERGSGGCRYVPDAEFYNAGCHRSCRNYYCSPDNDLV